jgi:hypothetical protein
LPRAGPAGRLDGGSHPGKRRRVARSAGAIVFGRKMTRSLVGHIERSLKGSRPEDAHLLLCRLPARHLRDRGSPTPGHVHGRYRSARRLSELLRSPNWGWGVGRGRNRALLREHRWCRFPVSDQPRPRLVHLELRALRRGFQRGRVGWPAWRALRRGMLDGERREAEGLDDAGGSGDQGSSLLGERGLRHARQLPGRRRFKYGARFRSALEPGGRVIAPLSLRRALGRAASGARHESLYPRSTGGPPDEALASAGLRGGISKPFPGPYPLGHGGRQAPGNPRGGMGGAEVAQGTEEGGRRLLGGERLLEGVGPRREIHRRQEPLHRRKRCPGGGRRPGLTADHPVPALRPLPSPAEGPHSAHLLRSRDAVRRRISLTKRRRSGCSRSRMSSSGQ